MTRAKQLLNIFEAEPVKVGDMVRVTAKWKQKNEPKMSLDACQGQVTAVLGDGKYVQFKNKLGGGFTVKPEDLELVR